MISLLMPVRDPDLTRLARTVASVRAQDHGDWELCIVDDCSDDPRVRQAISDLSDADPRIRIVWRMRRTTSSASFNAAFDIARGEHVALLGPGDVLPEHALSCIAATIEDHPRAAIVYSNDDCVDEDHQPRTPACDPEWHRDLFEGSGYHPGFGAFRRELVRRVGGFREGFDGAEEFDLALRCAEAAGPDAIVHVPHERYHAHDATPAQDARIALIVVDDASLTRLQRCIHALRTQADWPTHEILVATRRSRPLRNACFTGLRWVGASNAGLSDACNRAAAATQADFIALIDSRCHRFEPGWLRILVEHASTFEVGSAAGNGCVVMRRWIFQRESGFDPSYADIACAAIDLSRRISLRGLEHRWISSLHARLHKPPLLKRLATLRRRRREQRRLREAWPLV